MLINDSNNLYEFLDSITLDLQILFKSILGHREYLKVHER